jgi:DNA-binding FadR family transcriptional regulator
MPGAIIHKALAIEAVELLRERINTGEYVDYLLPERHLATNLGVSRPTLREALAILEKDAGEIAVRPINS